MKLNTLKACLMLFMLLVGCESSNQENKKVTAVTPPPTVQRPKESQALMNFDNVKPVNSPKVTTITELTQPPIEKYIETSIIDTTYVEIPGFDVPSIENTTELTTTSEPIITTTFESTTTTFETTTTPEVTYKRLIPFNDNTKISNNFDPLPKKDFNYFDSCNFVGDSIVESFSGFFILDSSQVIAKIGTNPIDINTQTINTYYGQMTALKALQISSPKYIYIELGCNGLDGSNEDYYQPLLNGYSQFLDSILESLPNTKIYVISLTPVTDYCDYDLNNLSIQNFNKELYKLCIEKNIYYVDVYNRLFNSDGSIMTELYEPDGLHFTGNGCKKFLDILLENTAE